MTDGQSDTLLNCDGSRVMPFFGRTGDKSLQDRKPTDWVLAEGERDGFPMIVRMADAYTDLAPVASYGHHVILSVHFRNRQPNGFPSSEEGDDLQSLEENVSWLLEAGNESLCVLVITNNGLRDFIFYTRNADSVRRKLEDNPKVFQGFVVEFAIEPDDDWRIYKAFSGMLKGHPPGAAIH